MCRCTYRPSRLREPLSRFSVCAAPVPIEPTEAAGPPPGTVPLGCRPDPMPDGARGGLADENQWFGDSPFDDRGGTVPGNASPRSCCGMVGSLASALRGPNVTTRLSRGN